MIPSEGSDSSPSYWDSYSNLQRTKHALIESYLGGWFPKLGSWAGRILYLDTHAGRGRHVSGEAGSPLVALQTLLGHRARDSILAGSEARFFFVECDPDNAQLLEAELSAIDLPERIYVTIARGDCYEELDTLVGALESSHKGMAPAFVFVDPYGFKVPGQILRRLMQFPRVELFINVIWRELDMAVAQARKRSDGGMADTLDLIFEGRAWIEGITSDDFDERAHECIALFQDLCGAKWATYIRMLGGNHATRYLLLHLTNHDAGRDLMKDAIWRICPEGSFVARKLDDPNQDVLIEPEPDLSPLEDWVLGELRDQQQRWSALEASVRNQIWRTTHLNSVVRELRRSGQIEADGYEGRFARTNDPLLKAVLSDTSA